MRGASPERRLAERQARTAPLVEAFGVWVEQQRVSVSAKSRFGEALDDLARQTMRPGSERSEEHTAGLIEIVRQLVRMAETLPPYARSTQRLSACSWRRKSADKWWTSART